MIETSAPASLTASSGLVSSESSNPSVAINAIEKEIPVTNEQFSLLTSAFLITYGVMYGGGGKLLDILGTRRGFTLIMVFWSLACASHGLATTFAMLAISRLLLGAGEGGGFPAATRAVA